MRRELMWAAGFYEGEGSISATGHMLLLSVAQVEREPLERFQRAVGSVGVIRWDGRIHRLAIYGFKAQRVAMALWPELSSRRQRQVLDALFV